MAVKRRKREFDYARKLSEPQTELLELVVAEDKLVRSKRSALENACMVLDQLTEVINSLDPSYLGKTGRLNTQEGYNKEKFLKVKLESEVADFLNEGFTSLHCVDGVCVKRYHSLQGVYEETEEEGIYKLIVV